MNNPFVLNPELKLIDLKDAMQDRIDKSKSIVSWALGLTDAEIDPAAAGQLINLLWSVHDYLEDIDCLYNRLDRMTTGC